MKKVRKLCIWYWMFQKRLLRRRSFLVLLFLIPVLVPAVNAAMAGESGALTITLCNAEQSREAQKIIRSLMEEDGIVRYSVSETEAEAVAAVEKHQADAAWIFEADFEEKINAYASGKSRKPFVTVIEREDTIALQLSREKLYGAVFQSVSYAIYRNFVYSQLVTEARVPEVAVRDYYDSTLRGRDLIEMRRLESGEPAETVNYLIAPMRGLLSLLVVLCGLAAAMYFLKDRSDGRFDWMPAPRRVVPAFAACFSAVVLAALAVLIALYAAGISVGFWRELFSVILFALSATGFCLFLCVVFRSAGKLGAAIPGIMIIMLVLSPIFFNMKILRPVRLLLPTYYYLQSMYNAEYFLYTVIYCAGMFAAVWLLNKLLNRRERRVSLLG